jgi:hypothetical protein
MEFKIWESSTVYSTEYNADNKTLIVVFKNGTTYEYYNFQMDAWEELLKAESIGKYLNANVKGKYDYEKITD